MWTPSAADIALSLRSIRTITQSCRGMAGAKTGSDTHRAVWNSLSIGNCCDMMASGSSNLELDVEKS